MQKFKILKFLIYLIGILLYSSPVFSLDSCFITIEMEGSINGYAKILLPKK